MAAKQESFKKSQLEKANSAMFGVIAAGIFVVIFCLIASNALLSQRSYQQRVTSKKEAALTQLEQNVEALPGLTNNYNAFVDQDINIIGGSSSGTGPQAGDNARIVLDALPSRYDYPALAASLEKLLSDNSFTIRSIQGTDETLSISDDPQSQPAAVEMPFQLVVNTEFNRVGELLGLFERSIRPIVVDSVSIQGNSTELTVSIEAKTFYQPGLSLELETEVVR